MIETKKIESIEPGNPFLSDFYRMGAVVGTNCTVMFSTHPSEKCKEVVIVNTETGERISVTFGTEGEKEHKTAEWMSDLCRVREINHAIMREVMGE